MVPKLINDVAAADEKNRVVGLGHMAWSTQWSAEVSSVDTWLIYANIAFALGALLAAGGTLGAWRLCVSGQQAERGLG